MLLPGLPDNLACFAAGLTRIPLRKLVLAVIVGRFPAALALALFGDGWSGTAHNTTLYVISAVALVLTGLYLWERPKVEKVLRKFVDRSYRPEAISTPTKRLENEGPQKSVSSE
jgi:uncharacterized membrane protein YdjX (TVP38/TMEM64 family)